MKQVILAGRNVAVEEVPAPLLDADSVWVLVRNQFSCVSRGTELTAIGEAGQSPVERVAKRPGLIKRTLSMAADDGLGQTYRNVRQKLTAPFPLGYSSAGRVVEAGSASGFRVGQEVACAGEYANHAEFVSVPAPLTTAVPAGVSLRAASTVAMGAIALNSVRRAAIDLGEVVVVLGMGMLGQIASQLLATSGAKGVSVDPEPSRLDVARSLGAAYAVPPAEADKLVLSLTGGQGADAVLVTGSGKSNDIINHAFRLCRARARVVVVGDVGLGLERSEMYAKELDLLMARSYGPGRYDLGYEQESQDYPYPYVRWTENRNMEAYLGYLAEGRVNVEPLLEEVYPIDRAAEAYEALARSENPPLTVLLDYGQTPEPVRAPSTVMTSERPSASLDSTGRLGVCVVGTGQFALNTHLPNLDRLKDLFSIKAIVSSRGASAASVAKQYGAAVATTDLEEVLARDDVDAVLIATRHDTHAKLAIRAIEAGKAVFVEKPVALSSDELASVFEALGRSPVPFTVGFNRRFSPFVTRLKQVIGETKLGLALLYRVSAGFLPSDSWALSRQGGGRVVGEACHMLDTLYFLAGKPEDFCSSGRGSDSRAGMIEDNFAASFEFEGGAVGSLVYSSAGAQSAGKEFIEGLWGENTAQLNDFRSLLIQGPQAMEMKSRRQDKGHLQELEHFARHVRGEEPAPIPLDQIELVSRLALDLRERLVSGAKA